MEGYAFNSSRISWMKSNRWNTAILMTKFLIGWFSIPITTTNKQILDWNVSRNAIFKILAISVILYYFKNIIQRFWISQRKCICHRWKIRDKRKASFSINRMGTGTWYSIHVKGFALGILHAGQSRIQVPILFKY